MVIGIAPIDPVFVVEAVVHLHIAQTLPLREGIVAVFINGIRIAGWKGLNSRRVDTQILKAAEEVCGGHLGHGAADGTARAK